MTERGATAVKICGIGSVADYDVCRSAGAAFVGMVFFPRSPRHLEFETASAIATHADTGTDSTHRPARVALTVDMDDEGLAAVIDAARPDYIQLHGGESPARAADIRRKFGLPLIRAIRVAEAADLEVCAEWDGCRVASVRCEGDPADFPAAPAIPSTGTCWPTMPETPDGCLQAGCRWRMLPAP